MNDMERLAKMEAVVKRNERLLPLFDSTDFKEFMEILGKKVARYQDLLAKAPRIGDVQYAEQIAESKDGKVLTKVPSRVTIEQQNEISSEYLHKIQELNDVISIPALLKADAEQMKLGIEKIKQGSK